VFNALTVDVEDWFQVAAFEGLVRFEEWERYPSRVELGTGKILKVLAKWNVRATFFVLGWVAEGHPQLVERIHEEGHEIATHGYSHKPLYAMTRDDFAKDLHRSMEILKGITGQSVRGYRAPSFSVVRNTFWAFDVMRELGLTYDSSIFPISHVFPLTWIMGGRYGGFNGHRFPYRVSDDFFEFPLTTFRVLGRNLPMAGGGYFRVIPSWLMRWALRKLNLQEVPGVLYLHPWEFDTDQPRLPASRLARFRQYYNVEKTEIKLERLLKEFTFVPIVQLLESLFGLTDFP
jgi:polysaccharide deacetylase family protein (PEP-CTERM system associated)